MALAATFRATIRVAALKSPLELSSLNEPELNALIIAHPLNYHHKTHADRLFKECQDVGKNEEIEL
jgi:hypothetical protein